MTNDAARSPTSLQFFGMDVWQLLLLRASTRKHEPFMIWHPFEGQGRTWTYGEFARDAASIAVGLKRRGTLPGDRVLIHLENCPEFLISWFACAALGAVAVTTNVRSAGDELRYYAEDCAAVGAITQSRYAETVSDFATELRWQVCTDSDQDVLLQGQTMSRSEFSFASLMDDPDDLVPRAADAGSPMSIQYTSGTTSRPKGVVWTHANALWGSRVNAVHEDLHPNDCHLVYMPLFHTNALAYSVLASLWVGARFVLLPKWSSSRFWEISRKYHCTWLSLISMSLRTIAEAVEPKGHSYRLLGGPLCDLRFDQRLGVKTIGWWGMTETISHPIVGDPYLPNRPMSMGRVAPEYGVAVVREDGFTPVEPDETGQLLVKGTRGFSLFAEYLNNPAATAESFDERGWFRTGDLVTPHSDGHISFSDRSIDTLKVGGENVAASEIERVVMGVRGVRESAVVGRSDLKLVEVPVVYLLMDRTEADIAERVMARCREMLADFKVPRAVYVVSEMPRSTLGKINKRELREATAQEWDLASAAERWTAESKRDPSGDATDSRHVMGPEL